MKYLGQTVRVVTAEIERQGRFLITRRPAKGVLPDLWEFPGGRVHHDESDETALRRKLAKLLNVEAVVGAQLMEVQHPYEQYTVELHYYRVDIGDQEPHCLDGRELRWVAPEQFGDYQFPAADEQTVALLLQAGESLELSMSES